MNFNFDALLYFSPFVFIVAVVIARWLYVRAGYRKLDAQGV